MTMEKIQNLKYKIFPSMYDSDINLFIEDKSVVKIIEFSKETETNPKYYIGIFYVDEVSKSSEKIIKEMNDLD